jgi:hypothetical protein
VAEEPIFQTPEWLQFVATTQQADIVLAALCEGRQVLGYFAGLIVRRCGLKVLGSPLPGWTTSYMGLNLSQDVPRRLAVQALIHFAFDELDCVHLEMMDRNLTEADINGLGRDNGVLCGFEIDLTQSEDELFANMEDACRRCIRKAQKNGVIIEEAYDEGFADDYYSQLEEVFRKQSLVPTYDIDRVRQLIGCVHETGQLLLLRARSQDGRCIATGVFPAMNATMYFWGGASRQKEQYLRPNELMHWYAMTYWKRQGMKFYDMGGGGEYKRKFGGRGIRIPWVRVSKYAWISGLRELNKHVVRWRQSCLGTVARRFRN